MQHWFDTVETYCKLPVQNMNRLRTAWGRKRSIKEQTGMVANIMHWLRRLELDGATPEVWYTQDGEAGFKYRGKSHGGLQPFINELIDR